MPHTRTLAAAIASLLLVLASVGILLLANGPSPRFLISQEPATRLLIAQEPSPGRSPAPSPEPLLIPETLDRVFEDTDETSAQREALVSSQVEPWIRDEAVLAAMRTVPRHAFIPTEHLALAYADHPLPVGYGQTISQPSLVAFMTELLEVEPGDRVLEIGTGSGYQAAILAELTDEVHSIEIVPELAGIARAVLDELGYEDEVAVRRADGYFGWEDRSPFDAIIVTAAPDHLPRPLVNQLEPEGGRMVIPIGPVGDVQVLWLVTREGDEVSMERLLDVRFVPFTRETDG
ncbi:MAG: protein-L-isoaspartate(D-aspartate) O-methyltransferase [Chloroflexota bacterium]|jgi:protein-L-isoaspartate(D-aspartate) O-methyltransferase